MLLFHRPCFLWPHCDGADIELSFTFNGHIHPGWMNERTDGWPESWQQREKAKGRVFFLFFFPPWKWEEIDDASAALR